MGIEIMSNTAASYQNVKPARVETAAPQPDTTSAGAVNGTPAIDRPVTQVSQGETNNAGTEQGQQPTEKQIKSAITSANKRAQFGHTNAEFSYHEATKRISVKIIDKDTNEVIREIPPEETLEMISKMWELAGIMVDEKR